MKRAKAALLALMLAAAVVMAGCGAGSERVFKSFQSNFGGGLDREAVLYDYEGEPIKTYEGRFDMHPSDPGKVVFDLNGKRTIIHGGIFVVDEK